MVHCMSSNSEAFSSPTIYRQSWLATTSSRRDTSSCPSNLSPRRIVSQIHFNRSHVHQSSHIIRELIDCILNLLLLNTLQAFKPILRPSRLLPLQCLRQPQIARITPLQLRLLSTETKAAIDKAVGSAPVVLFMKGTPEIPQCGFSRASIQILGLQGVDPQKFTAFNVLEDESLRQGTIHRA